MRKALKPTLWIVALIVAATIGHYLVGRLLSERAQYALQWAFYTVIVVLVITGYKEDKLKDEIANLKWRVEDLEQRASAPRWDD